MPLRYVDASPTRRCFSNSESLVRNGDASPIRRCFSPTLKVCNLHRNWKLRKAGRLEHKERKKHKQSNFILKVSVHFEGPAKIWETKAFVYSVLYVHFEDNTEQYSTWIVLFYLGTCSRTGFSMISWVPDSLSQIPQYGWIHLQTNSVNS